METLTTTQWQTTQMMVGVVVVMARHALCSMRSSFTYYYLD